MNTTETDTPRTNAAEAAYSKWRLGTKSLSSTPEQRKFTIENVIPDGFDFARQLERELNDAKFRVKSALETLDSMPCECADNPMGACDRCHAISILKPI